MQMAPADVKPASFLNTQEKEVTPHVKMKIKPVSFPSSYFSPPFFPNILTSFKHKDILMLI